MDVVDGVLEIVEVVPLAQLDDMKSAVRFQFGPPRQLRNRRLTEVHPDEPEVLLDRVARDPDFVRKAFRFGRLVDTLAGLVVLPAVVAAPHTVALDDADRQQHTAVSAAARDDVGDAVFATVEGELLVQNLQRDRAAGFEVLGGVNRLPALAQQVAGRPARAGVFEVRIRDTAHLVLLASGAVGMRQRQHRNEIRDDAFDRSGFEECTVVCHRSGDLPAPGAHRGRQLTARDDPFGRDAA